MNRSGWSVTHWHDSRSLIETPCQEPGAEIPLVPVEHKPQISTTHCLVPGTLVREPTGAEKPPWLRNGKEKPVLAGAEHGLLWVLGVWQSVLMARVPVACGRSRRKRSTGSAANRLAREPARRWRHITGCGRHAAGNAAGSTTGSGRRAAGSAGPRQRSWNIVAGGAGTVRGVAS